MRGLTDDSTTESVLNDIKDKLEYCSNLTKLLSLNSQNIAINTFIQAALALVEKECRK